MRNKLSQMFDINEALSQSQSQSQSQTQGSSAVRRGLDDAVDRILRASFWAPTNRPRNADVVDLAAYRVRLRSCPADLFNQPSPSRSCSRTTSLRRSPMSVPKHYRSIEEFEREELRPQYKVGFSFEDLMVETIFEGSDLLFDDTKDEFEADDDRA
jgi:hypothetical protein